MPSAQLIDGSELALFAAVFDHCQNAISSIPMLLVASAPAERPGSDIESAAAAAVAAATAPKASSPAGQASRYWGLGWPVRKDRRRRASPSGRMERPPAPAPRPPLRVPVRRVRQQEQWGRLPAR